MTMGNTVTLLTRLDPTLKRKQAFFVVLIVILQFQNNEIYNLISLTFVHSIINNSNLKTEYK